MKLTDFSLALKEHPSIADGKITNISSKKIYYLARGRNAWHSTWVQHYYQGSMATSLQDVERSAERMRERGSVFYISELPTICIESTKGALIVTEINNLTPLVGYSSSALSDDIPDGQELADDAFNNYFVTGAKVELAALSFRHDSRFWKKRPPPHNSVISLFLNQDDIGSLEPLPTTLYRRTSQPSGGSQNYLCWNITPSKIDSAYVSALAAEFRDSPPHS